MKEYNLISENKAQSNLPAKIGYFGRLGKFFGFELNEKQEKVVSDIKSFWTAELDFSEFKTFLHTQFKLFKSKDNILPNNNNNNEL